jgi:protein-tyrosine-phosphatase
MARQTVLSLALGYFLAYIPYALLTKVLSSGLVPGVHGPVGGLVLLPASAIGQLVAMPIFLIASGRWRDFREQRIGGRRAALPGRDTVLAGLFTALVIGTTTLNFTFRGVSVLFMLLLMRAGVLILSPIVDLAYRHKVHVHAWMALGLSLLAVAVALGDVNNYRLTAGAVLSLCAYLAGYVGRFRIMSKVAKTGVRAVDRRYFAEEHVMAPIFLTLLCAAGAVLGQADLRAGFGAFLITPAGAYAAGIGALYECLFIFGTLIYLDVRAYAWCVPVNRVASLFSGLVASYLLMVVMGLPPPGAAQLVALGFIAGAIVMLSYPALRARRRRLVSPPQRLVLFVCGGNQARSPIAECISLGLLAAARAGHLVSVESAGVKVHAAGAPMTGFAYAVLRESGFVPHRHRSRPLTAELCRRAVAIYCMTAEQCAAVIALAPEVADRTQCLDAAGSIPEPSATSLDEHRRAVAIIRRAVRRRLAEHSIAAAR